MYLLHATFSKEHMACYNHMDTTYKKKRCYKTLTNIYETPTHSTTQQMKCGEAQHTTDKCKVLIGKTEKVITLTIG